MDESAGWFQLWLNGLTSAHPLWSHPRFGGHSPSSSPPGLPINRRCPAAGLPGVLEVVLPGKCCVGGPRDTAEGGARLLAIPRGSTSPSGQGRGALRARQEVGQNSYCRTQSAGAGPC